MHVNWLYHQNYQFAATTIIVLSIVMSSHLRLVIYDSDHFQHCNVSDAFLGTGRCPLQLHRNNPNLELLSLLPSSSSSSSWKNIFVIINLKIKNLTIIINLVYYPILLITTVVMLSKKMSSWPKELDCFSSGWYSRCMSLFSCARRKQSFNMVQNMFVNNILITRGEWEFHIMSLWVRRQLIFLLVSSKFSL